MSIPSKEDIIEAANRLSPWVWVLHNGLTINGKKFDLRDHAYQKMWTNRGKKNIVVRKTAAQVGKTIGTIIHELHHLIYGLYPQGAMFVFPDQTLSERFSKSRFTAIIEDNAFLRKHIQSTDTIALKRVGKSNLYFVGGRSTAKLAGEQKTSAAAKSEPVDSLNFDEYDEIDSDIATLLLDRLGHSELSDQRISYTSTPSIPDWGIDKKYNDSDQCLWMIKCRHCNTETCLEIEFPECLKQHRDKRWFRACKKCGQEVFVKDGLWVPQYPDREMEGSWASKLLLSDRYVDLGKLLKNYESPPNGKIEYFMNGTLGMAYLDAENRLTLNDMLAIIGRDPMMTSHPGPTAMGVDVGNDLHIIIVDKPYDRSVRLIKACIRQSKKLTDFSELYDLINRFNVKCCVIDFAPAQQKIRSFMADMRGQGCKIYGNIYQQKQRGVVNWDSREGTVKENRTEICDQVHELVTTPGRLIFPRRTEEINEVCKQFCNLVKREIEDPDTGSKEMEYRKTGPDHYRHAMNYAVLAAERIGVYVPKNVIPVNTKKDAWAVDSHKSKSWMAA